mmetsp:Transcript_3708/g.8388  ORF Transcript_3708/g.8388 Transcript_3708/m.8388 type:complete len:209 (+) Transcript_3708:299-925(+)
MPPMTTMRRRARRAAPTTLPLSMKRAAASCFFGAAPSLRATMARHTSPRRPLTARGGWRRATSARGPPTGSCACMANATASCARAAASSSTRSASRPSTRTAARSCTRSGATASPPRRCSRWSPSTARQFSGGCNRRGSTYAAPRTWRTHTRSASRALYLPNCTMWRSAVGSTRGRWCARCTSSRRWDRPTTTTGSWPHPRLCSAGRT